MNCKISLFLRLTIFVVFSRSFFGVYFPLHNLQFLYFRTPSKLPISIITKYIILYQLCYMKRLQQIGRQQYNMIHLIYQKCKKVLLCKLKKFLAP